MKWRKLALYIFFLIIMAVFYFHQKARIEHLKAQREAAQKICHLQKEAITQIELQDEFGHLMLKLKEGKWRLLQPVNDWADGLTVDNMLDTLIRAKAVKKITPLPQDLSPFGLDKPRVQMCLKGPNKPEFCLKLGSNTPNDLYVYALNGDGKAIYLLNSSLVFSLNKSPEDLRDKRLLDFDPARVQKIVIKNAKQHIILVKTGPNWQLQRPLSAKADNDEVQDLLFNLETARIKSFQSSQFKPQVIINLWQTNDKHPRWLKLALNKHELLGQSSYHPTSFVLNKSLWKLLNHQASYYQDRHFIHFQSENVTKVTIFYKGHQLTAQKQKGKWQITPPLAKGYEIDLLLDDLNNLKYLPKKTVKVPFTSPQAQVKLWNKNGKLVLNLSLFRNQYGTFVKKDNHFYAVKNGIWDSFPEGLLKGGK